MPIVERRPLVESRWYKNKHVLFYYFISFALKNTKKKKNTVDMQAKY